ncbi:MAG: hypothetical protein NTZ24_08530 [Deltaproteobacteria bacterium]|nr:hypothetical protein [Deltaproteobacteria bacterium]
MKRLSFILVFVLLTALVVAASAEEQYTFDPAETEKKPYHIGGYVEFKPILFGPDHDAAFYKLRFYNAEQGNTLMEWDGKVQLEGSYEKGIFRLYAKTNTDLKSTYAGGSEQSLFYEAYGSMKPSSSLKTDVGKKAMKWGKGYAWSPMAFLDRPKDPDDPELAQEGYIVTSADYIKSFEGPLKTISFTPVLLPAYSHINDESWQTDNLNVAGRLYLLLYDTDIDFVFLARGSKTDRFGVDFSRNVTTNFEIHGEFAYIRDNQKNVLDANGNSRQIKNDVQSYLFGVRHLTAFDLTTIIEYYHNGTGYSADEMKNYYAYINRGYNAYLTTGSAATLVNGQKMAETGFGRFSPMEDYLYVRLSQKEPFDILYVTPALTWMMNLNDGSYSLTPELLYTGITNVELRLRTGLIVGARNMEFGEKQNDYRIELRAGYYF